MNKSKTNCQGCGYPQAKAKDHGIRVCNACKVVEEVSQDRNTKLIYVEEIGTKQRKYITSVANK